MLLSLLGPAGLSLGVSGGVCVSLAPRMLGAEIITTGCACPCESAGAASPGGSAGPTLCARAEGGQGPREAGRGAGSAGLAPGRSEPPALGAGRPDSLTSAKLAALRLARDAPGAEGRREEAGGRVAAGRHGAGDPGPPPRPPVAAAVRAGAAPIAAASGTRGCR